MEVAVPFFKRSTTYLSGIVILALGTVLFTCCQLGTSALVAVPFITAKITGISLGVATSLVFACFVVAQLLLAKKWDLKILLQLPFSLVFGAVVDFYNVFLGLENWRPVSLIIRVLLLFLAICGTSSGAFLMVRGNFIMNAPDGIVALLSQRQGQSFGQMKLRFDLVMILIASTLGLVFLGKISGIGIGTIVSALTVGRGIRLLEQRFSEPCREVLPVEKVSPKR